MKKQAPVRIICLAIAAIMLAGALTVSAINGSPYENLKNAAINALFYDNATVELDITLWVNGEEQEHAWLFVQQGDTSRLLLDRVHSPIMHQVDEAFRPFVQEIFTTMEYYTDDLRITRWSVMPDGTQWYQASRQGRDFSTSVGQELFGPAGRASNQLRLAELAVDLLVGDLKNNLTIESYGDIRRIRGAITERQLPEFVRVLIDIGIDEQLRWTDASRPREDFQHVLQIPMRSLSVDHVSLVADVDNNGNLVYVNISGAATIENIFGEVNIVEGEIVARFTDIGTTVPNSPVQNAGEAFASEFYCSLTGTSLWRSIFFTLDGAGNVDHDSITTHRPPRISQNDLLDIDFDNFNIENLLAHHALDHLIIANFDLESWLGDSPDALEAFEEELLELGYDIEQLLEQIFDGTGADLSDEEIARLLDLYGDMDALRRYVESR